MIAVAVTRTELSVEQLRAAARRASLTFAGLLPPQSAVITKRVAFW
jgi:hypothetical protein